jgi:hypothetical protein
MQIPCLAQISLDSTVLRAVDEDFSEGIIDEHVRKRDRKTIYLKATDK